MSIKVVFCWSDISGYMAANWRALHALPDIDVFVLAFQASTETAFSDQLMAGIPSRLLNLEERQNFSLIEKLVQKAQPDAVVFSGWLHPPYRKLAFSSTLKHCALVMGMDTPWWGTWRQHLAPWLLQWYLQRMDRVVVAGERSWQYAQRLGIPSAKIQRGLYGIDYQAWYPLMQERQRSLWPQSFLFVGRYAPSKGIDILVEAYRQYRSWISDPWGLVCCGQGTLANHLQNQAGIENRGFVQPTDMIAVWQQAGAFLLPSRFDPWPIALVEASAAGLPVVCTDVCGSSVEVIRPGYNGIIVPQENPEALARALLSLHEHYELLPTWGKRAQQLAAPYAAQIWAERWHELLSDVVRKQC
jgi:glycosyltransferase involved in cell wall biosynthesis